MLIVVYPYILNGIYFWVPGYLGFVTIISVAAGVFNVVSYPYWNFSDETWRCEDQFLPLSENSQPPF